MELTLHVHLQGASSIIFPIIKAEGVRQMFFPATVAAYYRAPPAVKGRWHFEEGLCEKKCIM